MSDDLLKLAERCEAATGPDRGLMCAAFKAVFPEVSSGAWDAIDAWDARYDQFCTMLGDGAHVDAAMTLVPEPKSFVISHCGNTVAHVQIIGGDPCADDPEFVGRAATPALALCCAAFAASAVSGFLPSAMARPIAGRTMRLRANVAILPRPGIFMAVFLVAQSVDWERRWAPSSTPPR